MNGYAFVWHNGLSTVVTYVDKVDGLSPKGHAEKHFSSNNASVPTDIEILEVRCIEHLRDIEWPSVDDFVQAKYKKHVQIALCKAFEIKKVTVQEALEQLNNEVINRALGLGWEPIGREAALHLLAWAMPEYEQAEAYRESIMDMAHDIESAVSALESIYENDADQFLEEEGKPVLPEPEALENMTDEELVREAQSLQLGFLTSDNVELENLRRYNDLTFELVSRGYEVHISNGYSATKHEEE